MVAAIALTGCGGGETGSSDADSSNSGKNAGNVATVITSALGDKSFSDSCWKGLNAIKDKYGVEIAYYEMKQDQTKAIPALTEYAEAGTWGIIVSGTYSTVENAQAVTFTFFRLFSCAPLISRNKPLPLRRLAGTSIFLRPLRYWPVIEFSHCMTSCGVPLAITSPPCTPAPGPISTIQSLSLIHI